jgi:Cupredoxin-like domain
MPAVLVLALAASVLPAAGHPPTAVGVGEREWRISLYRGKVPTGRVNFNVRNFGEDGHDLTVRNASGRVLGAIGEVRPGQTATLSVRLRKPGRYRLFCSLEGHEAKGMHALLRVKRRRPQ